MAELQDKLELAAPLEWFAEELLVVDTAGPNPATWPMLKAFPLQVQRHLADLWHPRQLSMTQGQDSENSA